MSYIVLTGRLLYSAIFIGAPLAHFSQQGIGYAAQQGVPAAGVVGAPSYSTCSSRGFSR